MSMTTETLNLLVRMRSLVRKEFGMAPSLQEDDVIVQYHRYGVKSQQPDLVELAAQLKRLMPSLFANAAASETLNNTSSETSSSKAVGLLIRMRPLVRKEFGTELLLQEQIELYYRYGVRSQQPELIKLTAQLAAFRVLTTPQKAAVIGLQLSDTSAGELLRAPPTPELRASLPTESEDIAPAFATPTLSEQESILELLWSVQVAQPTQFHCPGVPPFIIDKPQQRCLLSTGLQELLPLREMSIHTVRCEPVSPEMLAAFEKQLNRVSLEEFLWFCGVQLSCGTLLRPLQTARRFQFKQWLAFSTLPKTIGHMRMALCLVKTPCSLAAMIKSTAVPPHEAVAFLNAAFLCGWLREDMMALVQRFVNSYKVMVAYVGLAF